MKLVVSDASPLIVIAKSGLIPVLTRLVDEVITLRPLSGPNFKLAAFRGVDSGV
ncbi:MAG: hypothetical protein KIT82_18665 [Bradyrhizobium sp.]|nr:hypothetical protein [Bradyrhizobium sp.]